MRTKMLIALPLWMVLSCIAFAQDFYPLRIGNVWFYRTLGQPDSTISISVRVIGDSLVPNGHRYLVLGQDDIMGRRHVRADSTSVFYINPQTGQDQRVFRLDGRVGDTTQINWGPYGYVRLMRIDTMNVLGLNMRVLTFEVSGLAYAVMRFCEKFGPMTEWRYSDPPPPWPEWGKELVGCIIDGVRYGRTLDVSLPPLLPESFQLFQNYPNPFNPTTTITYDLPKRSEVRLAVYDMLGREVEVLARSNQEAGRHQHAFDGSNLASGVYFVRLKVPGVFRTNRMILLK